MKILYLEWNSVGRKDLEKAFEMEGHRLIRFPVTKTTKYGPELENELCTVLHEESPEAVFTVDCFLIFATRIISDIFHGFMTVLTRSFIRRR